MSLEQTIGELVAAVRENTAALVALANSQKTFAEGKTEPAEQKKPTAAKEAINQALDAAKEAKAKKEADAAAAAAAANKADETKALDYDKDIAPALTAFLKKHGRDAFGSLLSPFGAKKGGEIKANDYAAVLAAIDEHDLTA